MLLFSYYNSGTHCICQTRMKADIDIASCLAGDSDSTAVIACCCWGLLHGTEGVPESNYSKLEYRERLESSAERLYALSH